MKLSLINLGCIFALLLAGASTFANPQSEQEPATERRDFRSFNPEATAELGSDGVVSRAHSAITGVVYPRHQLALSLSVSGVVANVPVQEGDEVTAGSLLIALEQNLEKLELRRLELNWRNEDVISASRERLSVITEQLRLAQALYDESRSISRDELNAMRMQQLSMEAELATLVLEKQRQSLDYDIGKGRLEQRNLRAPLSGVVTRVAVDPGEWVQAGEPIVELVDASESFIRFSLPSDQANMLTIGDKLRFELEGEHAEGTVSFISPLADPASGRVEIKITFTNSDKHIRPGLTARISL